jgi:formate hydrogenlyase transcriptional activator
MIANAMHRELRRVVDTISELIWTAATDGSAEFVNRRWSEYTGLTLEEARGFGWHAAIWPEDLPRLAEYWDSLAASDTDAREIEARIRRADGVYRWFLFRCSPLSEAFGKVTEWYVTTTDIDDRKRAEDALRASEESFRLIVDSIPGLVFTTTPEGEVEFVNRQLLEYFGIPVEEVKRWTTGSVVHPDDLPEVIAKWTHAVEMGQDYTHENRLRRVDGVYRWFHASTIPRRNEDGRIVRWYSLLTDIEELKRLKDRLHEENLALREQIDREFMFEEIVGTSPALQTVLTNIVKVAPTDSTVLIMGETGTGKELIARAIHKRSPRAAHPFITVHCAAVPTSLIASELFGHEKGAFTGALQRRQGRFELANSGSIFLDEIGELPAETQVALLRVLQERQFERVGSTRPIAADVRIIAATNKDLRTAIADGSFRADLFYRLNVFPIEVPPLRQRKSDIPLLVEYFVRRYAAKARKHIRKIDKKTLKLCESYDWPGNIRELQNIIERSVILCVGDTFWIDEAWLSNSGGPHLGPSARLSETLEDREKEIIEAALAQSKGRVAGPNGAAARLGIPRSTLDWKIRHLKINRNKFAPES